MKGSLKDRLKKHKAEKEFGEEQGNNSGRVKNVSELLGTNENVSDILSKAKEEGRLLSLPPSEFVPDPNQPRKDFDLEALHALRKSIEKNGQIQPILVGSKLSNGKYPIIAGERRWRAISLSKTGLSVSAIERDLSDDNETAVLLLQIDENKEREPLTAFETSIAIKKVVDFFKSEGKDQAYTADFLGMSPAKISKYMSLIDAPDMVVDMSKNKETQDVELLYNLIKTAEKSPKKVEKLIDDWRDNKLDKNFRQASKDLKSAVSSKEKPKKPGKPKVIKAKSLSLKKEDDGFQIIVSLGAKEVIYKVDDDCLLSFKNHLNEND